MPCSAELRTVFAKKTSYSHAGIVKIFSETIKFRALVFGMHHHSVVLLYFAVIY